MCVSAVMASLSQELADVSSRMDLAIANSPNQSYDQRAKLLAPWLTQLIESYETCADDTGVQAFLSGTLDSMSNHGKGE